MVFQALNFWENLTTFRASTYGCSWQWIPAGVNNGMALITAGELPELDAAGGARGGGGGGGSDGVSRARRSMAGLLGEEASFLTDGAALRRVIGAVNDSGVAVDDVSEGANGVAGGVGVAFGGVVDFGGLDLLAGEQVLDLIP